MATTLTKHDNLCIKETGEIVEEMVESEYYFGYYDVLTVEGKVYWHVSQDKLRKKNNGEV